MPRAFKVRKSLKTLNGRSLVCDISRDAAPVPSRYADATGGVECGATTLTTPGTLGAGVFKSRRMHLGGFLESL